MLANRNNFVLFRFLFYLNPFIQFDRSWIDLDGANVRLTENVKFAPMPEKPYNRILSSLFQVNIHYE